MKKIPLLLLFFLFTAFDCMAYSYTYTPHEKQITVHGFLKRHRDKCAQGTRHSYPKKGGICVSCPQQSSFFLNESSLKTSCLKCPPNALLVKKFGYPMCVADTPFSPEKHTSLTTQERLNILTKTAENLSADYTVADTSFPALKKGKEPLTNACTLSYPQEKSAVRAVATCKKLKQTNDFLCPYVERNEAKAWICRACPKNAPYKNKDGGCFTCPYGEEIVSLPDGSTICASQMPKEKKVPKKKTVSGQKRKKRS